MNEITLYASVASRSVGAYWMLEELGVPYTVIDIDIRAGKQKSPEYLALNPSGKVPAITVDGVVVSELSAICAFLADRFGYGTLAPKIEARERGPYLKWIVYAGSVLDPAIVTHMRKLDIQARQATWAPAQDVVALLANELSSKRYLMGSTFTAADVALGTPLAMAIYNKHLPDNAALTSYNERLMARPAFQRAMNLTWPPHLFGGSSA